MTPTEWADALLARVEGAQPDVVRLAELASLAVQVDAPLLRRLRQELLPACDPGLESDLWFSPLVESQDDVCCTFHEALVPRLRERLRLRLQASDEPAFNRVASLTRAAHAHLPAAVRLEEMLTAWALRAELWDQTRMEQALEPALRALAGADEAHALEVARWAMQAAGRLPQSVRALLPMQALLVAAALRLQQPALVATAAGPVTLAATDLSWLVPATKDPARVRLGVALLPNGLLFDEPESGGLPFDLPRTTPLLVSLRWQDTAGPHQRLAQVAPGTLVEIEGGVESIELVTLAGDAYTLTRERQATATSSAVSTATGATSPEQAPAPSPTTEGVLGTFLDDCLLIRDVASNRSPAIAFPIAPRMWVTARAEFGADANIRTVKGWAENALDDASGDPFAAMPDNSDTPALLLQIRDGAPEGAALPLSTPDAVGSDGDWWTVTFVENRAQVVPVRPRPGSPVGGETFVVESAAPVRFLGAPVLCGAGHSGGGAYPPSATRPEMVVLGMVIGVESDANANAPPAGVLRVLSAAALPSSGQRARVGTNDATPPSAVTCAEFYPRSRHLLIAAGDGALRTYDADTGGLATDVAIHRSAVTSFALVGEHESRLITAGQDGAIRMTNIERDWSRDVWTGTDTLTTLAAADGKRGIRIFAGHGDGTLWALPALDREARSPTARPTIRDAHRGPVRALSLVGGSRPLLLSSGEDGRVFLWDTERFERVRELKDERADTGPVSCLATTSDGRQAVTGLVDGTLRVWDLSDGSVRRALTGHHRAAICAVAVSSDGSRILSSATDGTVVLWLPESDGFATTLSAEGPRVRTVALTHDASWAAAGSDDGLFRIWNVETRALVRQFRVGPARVFFSYAAADLELVGALSRALIARGITAHVDRSDYQPGAPVSDAVKRAIERSELVAPILSPRSLERPWLDGEVAHARSVGKALLPIATRERSERAFDMPEWLGSTEPLVLTPHELEASAAEVAARIAERLDSPRPQSHANADWTESPSAPARRAAPKKAPPRSTAKKKK